jgi:hypothetical protein
MPLHKDFTPPVECPLLASLNMPVSKEDIRELQVTVARYLSETTLTSILSLAVVAISVKGWLMNSVAQGINKCLINGWHSMVAPTES